MSVVADRVKELLDREFVCYETIPHVTDYTALETSEHTHIPGHAFAKAVIVLADGELVMAVVPAPHHVKLRVLASFLRAHAIKLAKEWRIRRHFPDCDSGAIPPFGHLYGLPVVIDPTLAEQPTVAFNAGSHEMAISMSYPDYEKLARPIEVSGLSHPWVG